MKLTRASSQPATGNLTHQPETNGGPALEQAMTDPLLKGAPVPKSLGRCADLYHDVRELRLLMEKECEAIKARETEIQEHIIANLPKGDTGASGLKYRAQVKSETKPQVSDEKGGWQAVGAYIAKNNRWDLLQKRLGEKAIQDLWDDGVDVPGVAKVHVPKLSITKI